MRIRYAILLTVICTALAAGASFVVAVKFVHRGPAGPRGPVGAVGPVGPRGRSGVTDADVVNAVEDDPADIATALDGELDYQDIQQNLDPDPADVASDLGDLQDQVDGLSDSLDSLCFDLEFAPAVEDDITSC